MLTCNLTAHKFFQEPATCCVNYIYLLTGK